ncbi:MAG: twin-arginine translocase TatA/TatE family subunit [Bacteroidota bacterium]|nr:twin-arginine translocase TatA/TatE family subunit [Bacteroidota bacterium]
MGIFLLLGGLQGSEIIIVALLILLLFGGKKIPELMKGIGKGIRSFKEGLKDVEDEITKDTTDKTEKKEEK